MADKNSDSVDGLIHEWLHQLEGFYPQYGVRLPKCGDLWPLHCDAAYGFTFDPVQMWKPWYKAFLNATLQDGQGFAGLGDAAWKVGTPLQKYYPPQVPPQGGGCAPRPTGIASVSPFGDMANAGVPFLTATWFRFGRRKPKKKI